MKLAKLSLSNGTLSLQDHALPRPASLLLTRLNLTLKDLAPLAAQQTAMPVSLSFNAARSQTSRREPGQVSYTGTLRLPGAKATQPFRTAGALRVERFPVHAIEQYATSFLNLDILRADTSVRATLDLALPPEGAALNLAGTLAVEDFKANTLTPAEPLLQWKALNLRGLKTQVARGQLKSLSVDETVLNDYFARVIITPDGRINLQNLVKREAPAEGAAEGATEPAPPATAPPSESPADIRFGPIRLVNGEVLFSDQLIQPNYTANLTELNGTLGSFNNRARADDGALQMADVSLNGRAEGTATVDITGRLNPLASPLALDLKGQLDGLDLPPLSPYSAKYAGYGIERGKLAMTVAYRIAPTGALTASNQIILKQLTFGERNASPDAPNLPVKLAVALLADRNGVIDLNLPISGSINDPQFRLGPTIVKAIFNLIGKALTAPFSLLASAFGGGEDISQVHFTPGTATLTADSKQHLQTLARALADRPSLQLTVAGESNLDTELGPTRRSRLNTMVGTEKRRQLARAGGAVPAEVEVSAAEYPALLAAVYRRSDIEKPRNVVGIAKDLPVSEMESLLMASIPVTADTMRELALARATTTRDFIASQNISADRLFLSTPVVKKTSDTWVPKAELKLGMK